MGVDTGGFTELTDALNALANELYGTENGGKATRYVLQEGAKPILQKMLQNASTDPKPRTQALRNSIKIGKVVKHRNGGWSVWIGVRRSENGAAYANPVEFGHGGPHPAPAHPFIRPAFDAGKDEAYQKMREILGQAIDARKNKK